MRKSLLSLTFLIVPALSFLACRGKALDVTENGAGDASSEPAPAEPTQDATAPACCPRDNTVSGCMQLGGSVKSGCGQACDFFCSTNWRVEKDGEGCEVWRWDTRKPQAGETATCIPEDPTTTDCSPACGPTEVCAKYQMLGGGGVLVSDGGTCPPGRHPNGLLCVLDPTFACVPKPSACGAGPLDCACADSICDSVASCPYQCTSTTASQVNCQCQTP